MIDEGLELLNEDECLRLLETESLGRVGLSVGALPAIFPVNYSMVAGAIIFRTGEGMKLRAALNHTVVAFEVDQSDADLHEGWSVLVVGLAEEVVRPAERDSSWGPPSPWAGGDRSHFVKIVPELISGRRIADTVTRGGVPQRPAYQGICCSDID